MRLKRSIGGRLHWVALVACAAAWSAAADELTIRGASLEKTITCDDRDVVIQGTSHRLTLRGRCQHVSIQGTNHVIHVEELGSAEVTGLNNRLEWEHALGGEQPDIDITGVNNRAVRVEGGPASRRSRGSKPEQGGAAVVEGGSGRVVIGADGVSIDGKRDRDRGDRVTITGDGTVEVDGRSGTVRARAERSAAASVTIADSGLQRAHDCAGGTVSVLGDDNQLTLSRCREVVLTGDNNRIVVVGPVRLIRVLGEDNSVQWSEGEGGRPPKVETAGSGNDVFRK